MMMIKCSPVAEVPRFLLYLTINTLDYAQYVQVIPIKMWKNKFEAKSQKLKLLQLLILCGKYQILTNYYLPLLSPTQYETLSTHNSP